MSASGRHVHVVSGVAAIVSLAILGAMTYRGNPIEEAVAAVAPRPTSPVAMQVPQSSGDQARLEQILAEFARGVVRVDALLSVPAAAESPALQQLVTELTAARDELRVLRDRFTDDYPPIQALLTRIGTIEHQEIPVVIRFLIDELNRA